MSNYSHEQFLSDVKSELSSIRRNATPEEIEKLDLLTFDPDHADNCIYGQMTGDCTSDRAHELISASCKMLIEEKRLIPFLSLRDNLRRVNVRGNEGVPFLKTQRIESDGVVYIYYLSPLETYILMKEANIGGVFAFLKGKIQESDLVL